MKTFCAANSTTEKGKRNANPSHNEIPPHNHYDGFCIIKQNKNHPENKKRWWGCGKTFNLGALLLGCSWDAGCTAPGMVEPLRKTGLQSLQRLNIDLSQDPAILHLGNPKELQRLKHVHVHPCSQQNYSQQPEKGSKPRPHKWMNGLTKHGIYFSSLKKDMLWVPGWLNH